MITISMMSRRDFVLQALATAIAPSAVTEDEHKYDSPTISVELRTVDPDTTGVLLTEHGDADYAIVTAFYYRAFKLDETPVFNLMLSKEATSPLYSGATAYTSLPIALSDVVFIKVKEMKLLTETKFGKDPHGN